MASLTGSDAREPPPLPRLLVRERERGGQIGPAREAAGGVEGGDLGLVVLLAPAVRSRAQREVQRPHEPLDVDGRRPRRPGRTTSGWSANHDPNRSIQSTSSSSSMVSRPSTSTTTSTSRSSSSSTNTGPLAVVSSVSRAPSTRRWSSASVSRVADEELEQIGGVGGGVDPAQAPTQPAAVRLVEQVGQPVVEQAAHPGIVEEMVLDGAVGEDGQRKCRVRAAQRRPSRRCRRSAEAVAQVRHQPLDGVAQVVAGPSSWSLTTHRASTP